jgi:hypothetical protein
MFITLPSGWNGTAQALPITWPSLSFTPNNWRSIMILCIIHRSFLAKTLLEIGAKIARRKWQRNQPTNQPSCMQAKGPRMDSPEMSNHWDNGFRKRPSAKPESRLLHALVTRFGDETKSDERVEGKFRCGTGMKTRGCRRYPSEWEQNESEGESPSKMTKRAWSCGNKQECGGGGPYSASFPMIRHESLSSLCPGFPECLALPDDGR